MSLSVAVYKESEDESLKSVSLRLWQDEKGETVIPMTETARNSGVYHTSIRTPLDGGIVWYFFVIEMERGGGLHTLFYGNNGSNTGGEGCMSEVQPPSFQITVFKKADVPRWYKDAVVYQIFPDRFARDEDWQERCRRAIAEEKGQAGQQKIIEEDWYRPAYYIRDEEDNVTCWPFYGGSLRGVKEKLPYLRSLGITAIYLNPIFKASSNHRYDTADYMEIDPMLGCEGDFRDLAEAARLEGISIILDGVFSHTGADSRYFDRYGNYGGSGAFNNENSEYRSWYDFSHEYETGYKCWWGVKDLPEVNENDPDFRSMICGEDGVIARWLQAGARGWRLDVADELPDSFIEDIRMAVKGHSGDDLLIGEVWEDASNKISYGKSRKYLMGSELDSCMNYPLCDMILGYLNGELPASEAENKILSLQENYPPECFYGALNLIGSHDRVRALSVLGADRDYDRAARRVKLASVLQYSLPGVPCIYYGDEAGMTGGADPENRSSFIWKKENADIQFHYRMLGLIYSEHPALKGGSLRMLSDKVRPGGDDDILAFVRSLQDDEPGPEDILVIVNRGDQAKSIDLTDADLKCGYALELLSSEELPLAAGRLAELVLQPLSAAVIVLKKEKPVTFDMGRRAGVICHVSSTPAGVLGSPARKFIDGLSDAGMSIWQILPLNPAGKGNSPYSSQAAFAGNEAFINYDELPGLKGFAKFCRDNSFWLDDYAEYMVLKNYFNGEPWYRWPEDYRMRRASWEKLSSGKRLADEIKLIKTKQFYFYVQWKELREYAASKGVEILGDLPVFVSEDSADVWANRELFLMDGEGKLTVHAGVPPDYFSPDGQNWGNPLYNWKAMAEDGYSWWAGRLRQCAERYDYVRLDHFRSFSEFYCIPEGGLPAQGYWRQGPGLDFFRHVNKYIRILAEDLGQLDTGVSNLLRQTGLPGMNVWQFSRDEMKTMSPEYTSGRVFYSGTHDNQTLAGWNLSQGRPSAAAMEDIIWLYESRAPWVMIQLQDMLLLGDEARMNVPGVPDGNWSWKLDVEVTDKAFTDAAESFRILAEDTDRKRITDAASFMRRFSMSFQRMDPDEMSDRMADFYDSRIGEGLIDSVPLPAESESGSVLALDMGGTNVRAARIRMDKSGQKSSLVIERQVRKKMPGREALVSCEEVFDMIASMIELIDRRGDCSRIGLSFSFPALCGDPGHERDARILCWDKELKIQGGEGRYAGQLINEALKRSGQPERSVVAMNDTVTAFMSHRAEEGLEEKCLAGFVLGTGANICFLDKAEEKIYNLESGQYGGFPSGDLDDLLDMASDCPGGFRAEKMMSGAYLPKLIEMIRAKAVEMGCIAEDDKNEDHLKFMSDIRKICIERCAVLSAVTVAAAVKLALKRSYGELRPGYYYIVTEGSTFWKVKGLKESICRYLAWILEPKGISCEFVGFADASLRGAAEIA